MLWFCNFRIPHSEFRTLFPSPVSPAAFPYLLPNNSFPKLCLVTLACSAFTALRIVIMATLTAAIWTMAAQAIAAGTVGEVVPVDGEPFRAALVTVAPDWKIQFDAGGALRTLPAADLVRRGEFVDKSLGPQVLLTDGSLIVGEVREIDREKLILESDRLGRPALRLEAVAAVLFHPPGDRHRRDQLVRRLLTTGGESDRVLLDNGDELSGSVAALHDDVLTLEAAAGKIEVELPRIAAVIFNPSLRRPVESSRLRAPGRPRRRQSSVGHVARCRHDQSTPDAPRRH